MAKYVLPPGESDLGQRADDQAHPEAADGAAGQEVPERRPCRGEEHDRDDQGHAKAHGEKPDVDHPAAHPRQQHRGPDPGADPGEQRPGQHDEPREQGGVVQVGLDVVGDDEGEAHDGDEEKDPGRAR